MEIDFSYQIKSKKEKAPLNKPFRLPSGNRKKFGVYVKNDKGNTVMVKFGDPNMEIKRDNPDRRKAYRSRHSCENPGPKWKANYWSCKMWSAKPVSKIVGDCEPCPDEVTLEVDIQAANKGLWYNIQQKKKRMGKNYKPLKIGSPNRPTQDAIKKAQASDYENGNYEWDGEIEFDQSELLKIDASLAQLQESTMMNHEKEALEMASNQLSATSQKAKQIFDSLSDVEFANDLLEPWILNYLTLANDYINTIHEHLVYPSIEDKEE